MCGIFFVLLNFASFVTANSGTCVFSQRMIILNSSLLTDDEIKIFTIDLNFIIPKTSSTYRDISISSAPSLSESILL